MRQIMSGEMSPTLIAAIIIGLRVKKETIGEIAGGGGGDARVRDTVEVADTTNLVDIVGTGGDGAHTFNISTAATFVAAPRPARASPSTASRSVSSSSGSADVLEALGANINLKPEQVGALDRRDRRRLHVRAQSPRRDEARRAGAPGARREDHLQHPRAAHQSGRRAEAADRACFTPISSASRCACCSGSAAGTCWSFTAWNGMDEISLVRPTMVGELKDGSVREYTIDPRDFGLQAADTAALKSAMRERVEGEGACGARRRGGGRCATSSRSTRARASISRPTRADDRRRRREARAR